MIFNHIRWAGYHNVASFLALAEFATTKLQLFYFITKFFILHFCFLP